MSFVFFFCYFSYTRILSQFEPDESFFGGESKSCRGGREGKGRGESGDHVVRASGNDGGGGEAARGGESDAGDVPWRTAAAKGRGWEVIGVDDSDEDSGTG